jgi:hypothetical protein
MPIAASMGRGKRYRVPGLYRSLHDEAARAAEAVDPRLWQEPDAQRAADSPVTKAAQRRLASLRAGEPQPIPPPVGFPGALGVPFIAATREIPDTTEEYDSHAWLVRVYADDRVEVGQTRGQMQEQARLVGQGFETGRIDENGDYTPLGLNPETGEWQPMGGTRLP